MVSASLPCGASSNAEKFLQGGDLSALGWLLQPGEHWDLFNTSPEGVEEEFPFYSNCPTRKAADPRVSVHRSEVIKETAKGEGA